MPASQVDVLDAQPALDSESGRLRSRPFPSPGDVACEEKREARKAKRALDELTSSSGGLSYYPKDLSEVDKIALQVAHEIRNQYTITYAPTLAKLDGSFRQIKVTVSGAGRNALVRTRTGYYATPDLPDNKTRANR